MPVGPRRHRRRTADMGKLCQRQMSSAHSTSGRLPRRSELLLSVMHDTAGWPTAALVGCHSRCQTRGATSFHCWNVGMQADAPACGGACLIQG